MQNPRPGSAPGAPCAPALHDLETGRPERARACRRRSASAPGHSDQAGYPFARPYRPKRRAGPSTSPRTADRGRQALFAGRVRQLQSIQGRRHRDSQHIRPDRCAQPSVAGEEGSLFQNSLFQDRCPSWDRKELRSRNGARRAKEGRSARPTNSSVATPKDRRRAATQSADKFNRAAASSRTACIRISSTAFLGRI